MAAIWSLKPASGLSSLIVMSYFVAKVVSASP
jgi:hypothetical protein